MICNRLDYLTEGYRQLYDPKLYPKLDFNLTATSAKVVANTMEEMFQNGEIDQSFKDFLLVLVCRTP